MRKINQKQSSIIIFTLIVIVSIAKFYITTDALVADKSVIYNFFVALVQSLIIALTLAFIAAVSLFYRSFIFRLFNKKVDHPFKFLNIILLGQLAGSSLDLMLVPFYNLVSTSAVTNLTVLFSLVVYIFAFYKFYFINNDDNDMFIIDTTEENVITYDKTNLIKYMLVYSTITIIMFILIPIFIK